MSLIRVSKARANRSRVVAQTSAIDRARGAGNDRRVRDRRSLPRVSRHTYASGERRAESRPQVPTIGAGKRGPQRADQQRGRT